MVLDRCNALDYLLMSTVLYCHSCLRLLAQNFEQLVCGLSIVGWV